jgi:hypothetical protein
MNRRRVVPSFVDELMETVSALPIQVSCSRCGSRLRHVEATFFSSREEGKAWKVLLSIMPRVQRRSQGCVHASSCSIGSHSYAYRPLKRAKLHSITYHTGVISYLINNVPIGIV